MLGFLEKNEEISDSGKFACEQGLGHDEIVNVINSLNGFGLVDAELPLIFASPPAAGEWRNFSEAASQCGSDVFTDDYVEADWNAPADTSKLQSRSNVSKARWIHDLGMAELLEVKGKMWISAGVVRGGKTYYTLEETAYLAHIGALHLFDSQDMALSLEDIYTKFFEEKNGCSWVSFQIYKRLKSLGYVVGRHGIPWTMKIIEVNSTSPQDSSETDEKENGESGDSILLTKTFSCTEISKVRPLFDVYPPNSKFKKTSPGSPCFVVCLSGGRPPIKQEIEELERRCVGRILRFCSVDHERVSFFSFNRLQLPVLP